MTATDNKLRLCFGYNEGLPDTATVAFGARFIVTQDGGVDLLPGRVSVEALPGVDKYEFLSKLDAQYAPSKLNADLSAALKTGRLDTRGYSTLEATSGEFTLKANCQASAGYCYVVIYYTEEGA